MTDEYRSVFSGLTIDDLKQMKTPEYLIENVLPQTGISFLIAREGSFKTFCLLDWALHVASNLPTWNGLKIKNGPVDYYAPEGAGGIGKRIRSWQQYYEYDGPLDFVLYRNANLFTKSGTEEIMMNAAERMPTFQIFDTLSRSMAGGDDGKTEHMNKVLGNAQELVDVTHGQITFAHHTKKDSDIYRGSTVIPGSADTMMFLDKKSPSQVLLKCTKQKDDEEFDDMLFEPDPIGDSLILKPMAIMEFKMTPADVKVWKLLNEVKRTTAKMLMTGTGVSQAVVYRSLEKFLKYNKAHKEGTEYVVGN